jgi:hypothetical protein
MGLNLSRLAQIKASVKKIDTAAPKEESKAAVSTALDELSALTGAIKLQPPLSFQSSTPASAGTIKFQEVSDKIATLHNQILSAHPRMPVLLKEIRDTLYSYPECNTLLTEDQMNTIIEGLEKLVDTDLAAITLKAASKGGKSKAPVSNASLGF